ncbi:MAG: hypothetical protein GC129_02520 [Proteobacteria bacterium]|nr:hypothetical protein [Pseudomonadota bacterium]
MNYVVDALNAIDEASGSRSSIAERLNVALNSDGTLKFSTAGALDEWIVQAGAGTLARVSDSAFSMSGGDFTAIYRANRRVQVTVSGVPLMGDVVSAAYAGGLTTVTLTGLVDESGAAAVIAAAPTQVGYGPVTSGRLGNMPRRSDGVVVAGASVDYSLQADSNDLVVLCAGSEVARINTAGVSGLAAASVDTAQLTGGLLSLLTMPAGAVMPFAGASAPSGWLMCYGQNVSRTTYAGLFAVVGTAFGAGDGSTTFTLPDLRGRSVFGTDNMGGTAASRVTSGVSGINGSSLGASGGSQSMHQHTHTVTDPGHAHGQTSTSTASFGAQLYKWNGSSGGYKSWDNSQTTNSSADPSNTAVATTGIGLANSGSGNSQNMPPALMLNYVIKT